jgi:hypothetical protein
MFPACANAMPGAATTMAAPTPMIAPNLVRIIPKFIVSLLSRFIQRIDSLRSLSSDKEIPHLGPATETLRQNGCRHNDLLSGAPPWAPACDTILNNLRMIIGRNNSPRIFPAKHVHVCADRIQIAD